MTKVEYQEYDEKQNEWSDWKTKNFGLLKDAENFVDTQRAKGNAAFIVD
jgi:hypothetical protein